MGTFTIIAWAFILVVLFFKEKINKEYNQVLLEHVVAVALAQAQRLEELGDDVDITMLNEVIHRENLDMEDYYGICEKRDTI